MLLAVVRTGAKSGPDASKTETYRKRMVSFQRRGALRTDRIESFCRTVSEPAVLINGVIPIYLRTQEYKHLSERKYEIGCVATRK